MTETTQPAGDQPAHSRVRVHPMAMLEELAAENDYLRKRCMALANALHALRNPPAAEQPKDES
jgi:hypothetical protein